ncbi:MAG: ChrR family anti-sigma-E factor [Xanthomonadales bacterium]|nr:ChrR family anti-sigma-E factor [Xanthomonadales bacterium]
MIPVHHLDDATLLSYASGALPEAMVIVASTHLEVCSHCRNQLQDADTLGGLLLVQQQLPDNDAVAHRLHSLRAALTLQLEDELAPDVALDAAAASSTTDVAVTPDPDWLPTPLHAYFGARYSELRWRWVGPGMHCIRASKVGDNHLILLKIAPGRSLPLHSHGGNEMTQILRGAYNDSLGHFAAGDMADLDASTIHQPVTCPGVACICVAALDAPLVFSGWFARKLQPLVGL